MTKLEYLFEIYECDNISTLRSRCPINLNLLNLCSEAEEDFKDYVKNVEHTEDAEIYNIIKDRL